MQRFKSVVLPVALIAGYFLRSFCASIFPSVPYVIFTILLLTFSSVRLVKLRPTKLDAWIALFQITVSIGLFWGFFAATNNEILSQGAMMCVLCPVASSVTVVAAMMGANPVRTTTYTIIGNIVVALEAPIYISLITDNPEIGFVGSFTMILLKIASVIALPFVVVLLLQCFLPAVNEKIAKFKQASFYLWAFALFVTIGQTADFVVMRWQQDAGNVLWLGVISLGVCGLQFAAGKYIGSRYGDRIAGGQMLAQKNSAIGIWIINSFMNPIASVAMAFYSVWQNLFNSWQIYRKTKEQ